METFICIGIHTNGEPICMYTLSMNVMVQIANIDEPMLTSWINVYVPTQLHQSVINAAGMNRELGIANIMNTHIVFTITNLFRQY